MIQVIHQGASWHVLRDVEFVQGAGRAGVFLTKEHAEGVAERTGEGVSVQDEKPDPGHDRE